MSDADTPAARLSSLFGRIARADARAGRDRPTRLLAVGKLQPAAAIRALAQAGQHAFGENYVQEAQAKRAALADLGLEWHLVGHLQSNKCREAARLFDWIQSIDRTKLLAPLAAARDPARGPLNLLIQVDIDDEPSKAGCRPAEVGALADAIAGYPSLALRGLMAIPAPAVDPESRRSAFARMRALFEALRAAHPGVDTLSMGMSDDFELAIAEGATLVRVGTALFGPRPARGPAAGGG